MTTEGTTLRVPLLHTMLKFRRYKVREGRDRRAIVERRCAEIRVASDRLGLVNPFGLYTRVIDALDANKRLEVRPLSRLMSPVPEGKTMVALRHDVDADISTGLRAASCLAQRNVPGSFYLLHTAHYYGAFADRNFLRHPAIAEFVADLLTTGCEIGLHNDALAVYCGYERDGGEALCEEIAWLRCQGATITGTVAHNSAPAYGAENFEIFYGRAIGNRHSAECSARQIPLQVLREERLGLTYEGNYPILREAIDCEALANYLRPPPLDAVRSFPWLQTYLVQNPIFERAYDVSLWLLARDAWAIAQHGPGGRLSWPVDTDRMLGFVSDQTTAGQRLVFVIHPLYVSGAN